ncbi:MAG TPA: hypothetical protein VI365_17895 [Trebonia sp.]
MSRRFPPPAKAAGIALLCAALAPLTTACHSSSSAASPAASSQAATSSQAPAKASAPAASGSAASGLTASSAKCLSATAVSSAAGGTYPAPKSQFADGLLSCNYASLADNTNLNFGVTSSKGVTPSVLRTVLADQNGGSVAGIKPLPGYGTAAYILTLNDATTNSLGIATTIIIAENSSIYVTLAGEVSPAHAEAVTRLVLAG